MYKSLHTLMTEVNLASDIDDMFIEFITNISGGFSNYEINYDLDPSYVTIIERYISDMRLREISSKYQRYKDNKKYIEKSQFHSEIEALSTFISDNLKNIPINQKFDILIIMIKNGNIEITNHYSSKNGHCDFNLITTRSANIIIFRQYYRFLKAMIKIQEVSDANNLDIINLTDSFGKYLENNGYEAGISGILRNAMKKFNNSGIKLDKAYLYASLWLDTPSIERGVRTITEWSHRPWTDEELKMFDAFEDDRYTRYEEAQQNKYLEEFNKYLSENVK